MLQIEGDQHVLGITGNRADQLILELRKMFLSENRRKSALFEQIGGLF
jgi:hypothetical protein